MTPGNVIDYEFIRRRIHELAEMYTIREIAFDPRNATQFSNQLQDDGFTMMEVKQGYPMMSEPYKDFEKHVIAGTLTHFGNRSDELMLLLFKQRIHSEGACFWTIPLKGGAPRKLWDPGMMIYSFDIHPDGKQIAISSVIERDHEKWLLENIFPSE